MDELEIFNLYEKRDSKDSKKFMDNIDSSLRVQTDYEKVILDSKWIEIMETTIPYIDNIFRNPNRFIVNEEELVKIELARKITVDSIKHLSRNTNLIQDIDKKTGDVKPSKILNINKEESYDTYENKLIYTLIQNMKFYVSKRKKQLEEMRDIKQKNDKVIEYNGTSKLQDEEVSISLSLNTKLNTKNDGTDTVEGILERVESLERKIIDVSSCDVYKVIDKKHITLVRPPIKKTNVILKNVNFQYAMQLWNFLQEEMGDDTESINDKQDYIADGPIKQMIDETFMLNYLAVTTLDRDRVENEETDKQITKQATEQLIEHIIGLNSNLTEEELQSMIGEKIAIYRNRNMATISEIQKIFKEHIDKYIAQIVN